MAPDRMSRTVIFKTFDGVDLKEIKDGIESETATESLVVLQQLKPGEYLAEVTRKADAEHLIEHGFETTTTHVDCSPPKGYYLNVSLMGIRAYVEDDIITESLEKYGEIKGPIVRLKYKTGHELAGLENGNRLVRMILSTPSIPYSIRIDNEWCRVIHSGQQPFCQTCKEFGHGRRYCKETECRKCGGKGHIAIDCKAESNVDETDVNQADSPSVSQMDACEGNSTPAENPTSQESLPQPGQNSETDGNADMETNSETSTGKEIRPNTQSTKRPHSTDTNTDTNTDSDTNGFTLVTGKGKNPKERGKTTRKSSSKPPPKLSKLGHSC